MTRTLVVADDVVTAAAERFLALRPRTIALAGGTTPQRLYERLAVSEYAWRETEIFFGDERCVPPDHADSNFRAAHEVLLSHVHARVHRMPGQTCDAQGYADEIARVLGPGVPSFDLVLLGLGEDGHTASLFPGDAALDVIDRTVVRVERPEHSRLTLTLPVLNAAHTAIFIVAGAAKRHALARLMAGGDVPAARVTAATTLVFADRAAGGALAR